MIRREPTRIELTMDDIQEYIQMRRDASEQQKRCHVTTSSSSKTKAAVGGATEEAARQTRAEAIRERIGFDPTPRNS